MQSWCCSMVSKAEDNTAAPGKAVKRFDDKNRRTQPIMVASLLVLAVGLGLLIGLVPDEDISGAVRLWSAILVALPCCRAWLFSRTRVKP